LAKSQEQLITDLNKVTLPFNLTTAQKDLVYLDTLLSNIKIIGLVEEIHATANFFLTKMKSSNIVLPISNINL